MTAPRVKLDIDTTREKLAALGLGYAVEALEPLMAEAVRAETPAHVFLDRLLEAERSGREERRIKTMLKSAKIPTGQTLETFDFAFQPAIERSRIETLATGAWIRNTEVILMQGPPGVGKSHLLCGLGIRAIQLGFSVQYFRFDELLTALRADAHLPPTRLKSRKYMSSALLLVDEMGYDPLNREDASLFFRLVSYRYGRGALAIGLERMATRWLTHHHQQEHPRLDRAAGRRRGAGHRDPRSAAAPRPRPQHQGPQLPASRSRGCPQKMIHRARRLAGPGRALCLLTVSARAPGPLSLRDTSQDWVSP